METCLAAPAGGAAGLLTVGVLRTAEAPADAGDERAAVELAALDEPVDLLHELQRLAAETPALARAEAPRRLAEVAVATWRGNLAGYGAPWTIVAPAFEASRREIWLWLEGDRRWSQLGSHLAGRVVRRLPVGAQHGTAALEDV